MRFNILFGYVQRDQGKDMKSRTQKPIELFSTAGGIRAVDSPVRVRIMSMLKERDMPFDEIVAASGKAKSTVSVHLNSMIQEGIISSRADPCDRRKKIFFLTSSYLGGLLKDHALEDDLKALFARGLPDNFEFFRIIFRTIRMELYSQGINIDPVLSDAGYKVGRELYAYIASDDLDELLAGMARLWSDYRLGTMEIESRSPLAIVVLDCFECSELPVLGRPVCAFDRGVLRAVLEAHSGESRSVEEIECYAAGNGRCRFLVRDGH